MDKLYSFTTNWVADYPWALNFVGPLLAPGQTHYAIHGYNSTMMMTLFQQAVAYSQAGDDAGLVRVTNQMIELDNTRVRALFTVYPEYFAVMTSNINGYYYNPSEPMQPGYYFATMC